MNSDVNELGGQTKAAVVSDTSEMLLWATVMPNHPTRYINKLTTPVEKDLRRLMFLFPQHTPKPLY